MSLVAPFPSNQSVADESINACPSTDAGNLSANQKATDSFCASRLNADYQQLIDAANAALCRKRPSPLNKGKTSSWAAGIIHAIGTVNFLYDKTQTPHCKAVDIYAFWGVSSSSALSKSKLVRDACS